MFTLKQMRKSNVKKNEKQYTVIQNMIYILYGIYQHQKKLIFLMFVNAVCNGIIAYFPSLLMRYIIRDIEYHVSANVLVQHIILICVFILAIMSVITFTESQIRWRMIDCRVFFLMKRVHKVLHMDYQYLETPAVMESCYKAKNATKGNNNGIEGMMHSCNSILILLTKILYAIIILAILNMRLVISNILMGLILLYSMNYTKKKNKIQIWDTLAPFWQKLYYMQNVCRNFAYAKDLRLYNMKDWLMKKYEKIQLIIHLKEKEANRNWMFTNIFGSTIFFLLNVLIHGYLAYCVITDNMAIADYTFYLGTAITFYLTIFGIFSKVTDLFNQSREVCDFRNFLNFPEDMFKDGEQEIPQTNKYEFVFENVSFCYSNSKQYAIKNLNLTITPGEKLAIVGLNGSGKTTLIKLLCGLYRPTSGKILLNGTDIQKFKRDEYFMLFAPVFQNIEIFAFSIATNVSMQTDRKTNIKQVYDCLQMVGLKDKANTMKNGINTKLFKILDEEGVDLSGGEKQKLAFARALYKNAPVLVLDEPTSAMDIMAEQELYQKFNDLTGGKTAIFISHHLSSTIFCDKIAMFEDGNIIEYGNHESLLKKNGKYTHMYNTQAKYYKKKGVMSYE